MNSANFQATVVNKLGDYIELPNNPFNEKVAYAIFPGAAVNYINETLYDALFTLNSKYGSSQLLVKPHFVGINDEKLFLKQSSRDWLSFSEMQENHLTCEGIYLSGSAFNWLGIYHYDDYLIVGGNDNFIMDLCNLVYGDADWKTRFAYAFNEGDISMYQSDYDALVEALF